MSGAAFFDLDRTILVGGSGPVITAALAEQGLVSPWHASLAKASWGVYDRLGESRLTMELARRMVGRARGWERQAVDKAAEAAVERLEEAVLPRARRLMDENRDAGRPVVLATTTAAPLVEPLARRLGVDAVVATGWECGDDQCYTGRLDGAFLWGGDKRRAVEEWCAACGVDMGQSYAYSDSLYDLPLLEAVGHPHAVNPDARLRAVARLRSWPVLDLTVPEGVPHVAGLELLDLARPFLRPELFAWARWRFSGLEHIPARGPAVLATRGHSPLDLLALSLAAARRGRKLRFATELGLARVAGQLRPDHLDRALGEGELVAVVDEGRAAGVATRTGAPLLAVAIWTAAARPPRRPQVEIEISIPG